MTRVTVSLHNAEGKKLLSQIVRGKSQLSQVVTLMLLGEVLSLPFKKEAKESTSSVVGNY